MINPIQHAGQTRVLPIPATTLITGEGVLVAKRGAEQPCPDRVQADLCRIDHIVPFSPLRRGDHARRQQCRILRHHHRIFQPQFPARRESVIQPQIKLMRLVNRILPEILPLLVIIQPIGVFQPDFRLLQRHVQAERRAGCEPHAALLVGCRQVIVIVESAQRRRHVPHLGGISPGIRRIRGLKTCCSNRHQSRRDK